MRVLPNTHARLRSVKRKYGKPLPATIPWERLVSPLEREVLSALAAFPDEIERAVAENELGIVVDYLLGLAAPDRM